MHAAIRAQQPVAVCSSDSDYEARLEAGLIGYEYINPVAGYKGDQYFNDWALGEVTLKNGVTIRNIHLRYDRYLDALLWLRKSDYKAGVLSSKVVSGFKLVADKLRPVASFYQMKVTLPALGIKDVYLQSLVTGNYALYVYRNVNITSTNEDVLDDNTRYFLAYAGNIYPVSLRRHSLLSLPVIQKTEMKAILKSTGIPINNNENGLIRAITLYNAQAVTPSPK